MRRFVTSAGARFGARRAGHWVLAASIACAAAGLGFIAIPGTFGATADTSSNPNNIFSVGTLFITTSNPNNFIVNFSNGVPGDVATGTLTVTNSGSLPATMTLSNSNVGHRTCAQNGGGCPAGVGIGDLSTTLTVRLQDLTKGTDVVASGTAWDAVGSGNPYSLPGTSAAKWAAGEAHAFKVTVTFPNGPSQNVFQGTSATFDTMFTGTQ